MAHASIAERFTQVAATQPGALALATGSARLSYGALARAVDELAGRLRGHGTDDTAVALALPHGAPLAIGVLATQRAGRVAVIVDPRMPAARRAAIVADAGASVLVGVDADEAATLTGQPQGAWKRIRHPAISAPDRPALLLYTSGSTGRPNGVVYSEQAILARVVDGDRFALAPGDRVGVFGGAGMNLFRTLLRGAGLISWDVARDGLAGVAEWIAREELTVLHCVPTLFRRLSDCWERPREWPHLRCVSLTGEPVVRSDVERFRRSFAPGCVLLNGLGTTEAGTFCQAAFDSTNADAFDHTNADAFDHTTALASDLVPVGRAVEGTEVVLYDGTGGPVADGETGEIVVHGALLAAGYWERPELEAERFGRDPRTGARCYRTGDLGRRRADGALVHLGRRDQQVKIRGVRVEPAEVEAALLGHPDVRQAAVVGHAEDRGEARLVACVALAERGGETAAELARFLRTRLPDALVPDGWTLVDALPLLSNGKVDRRALPLPPPRRRHRAEAGIVELFARQASARGNALAYRCGTDSLTYAELDRRSATLATALVAAGVGTEQLVAIALPRAPAYAIALLAVLRAGGACLPIDPAGPRERNERMLRESGARWLVARSDCDLGRGGAGAGLTRFDPTMAPLDNAACAPPGAAPLDAERLAFVLYTSGSTGQPKGVEITEGQVLHRLAFDWAVRPFAPGEVGCQRAALGFVDAIAEWLGGLLQGVATEILPDELLQRPRDLVATLAVARVTRILLVPSQLTLLLDTVPDLGARLPALRLWTASGEPLPPATGTRFRRAFPDAALWNVYGATEAWDATAHELRGGDASPVPIGRPLPGMRAYLLDEQRAPVASGVAGDLYVAGDGLARRYRDDPERTDERFVPNPFSPGLGDRLYHTGDRARWRDDGTLEHLGRSDRCVKLRGVRVELGEVEAVLAAHPDVREAAAVLLEDRLVAFVTPETVDRAALRAYARDHLLAAAIPGRIVAVAELPRNDRGKVDRTALRAPARPHAAPRTELEQTLAEVFADLLGRDPIGAEDDFFDLGGDSLLAVQLVAEIEALTGRAAALDAIAAAPTPRGIAATLTAGGFPWQTADCITSNPNASGATLFAICGAWGWAVRLLRIGRALGDEVRMHALQPPGMRWPADADIPAMAARYVETIGARAPSGPVRLLGTSFGGVLAFEVAVQLEARGRAVDLLAMVDSAPPGAPLREPPPPVGTSSVEIAGREVYMAHLRASERYEPRATFGGRVLYFQCHASIARAVPQRWERHARGGVEVALVPGEHGQFHVQPQLGAIVARLRGALANGMRPPMAPAGPADGARPAATLLRRLQRWIDPRRVQLPG